MTDHDVTINAVVDELAQLRARLDAQDTELAELRSQPVARRHLLRGLAGLGAAGVAGVAAARPAAADDGDPLALGLANSSTQATQLAHTASDGQHAALVVQSSGDFALYATTGPASGPTVPVGLPTALVGRAAATPEDPHNGVWGVTGHGFGVQGENDSVAFPAVFGANNGAGPGLAGVSYGHGAQLVLAVEDGADVGPPAGSCEPGYVRLDSAGDIWLCLTGGATSGTWTRLLREDTAAGRVVPITPIRALDTRAAGGRAAGAPLVPGQVQGPLSGGQVVTLDLAGVAPIPPSATGVVGNATVLKPTGTGPLNLQPAGATVPACSFGFTAGGTRFANGFTSLLAPTGLSAVAPVSSTITYHLLIDIAAYIT